MTNGLFGFFGLGENPFCANPDPRYIFSTPQAQQIWAELTYGIKTRKGLMLLAGEAGTGKTIVVRKLIDWLEQQRTPTALVFNSHLGNGRVLDFILNDFEIRCDEEAKSNKLLRLNEWLLARYRAGQTPVLIMDEAQGLAPRTLEEVRLLLNFETPREKLLQILLVGQPELEEKLKRPELRQLRQRITLRCRTAPFTLEETESYIQERLRIGGAREAIFSPEAMTAVHLYSRGIPRVINVICEQALFQGYKDGARIIPAQLIDDAAREAPLDGIGSLALALKSRGLTPTNLIEMRSIVLGLANASPLTVGHAVAAFPEQKSVGPASEIAALGQQGANSGTSLEEPRANSVEEPQHLEIVRESPAAVTGFQTAAASATSAALPHVAPSPPAPVSPNPVSPPRNEPPRVVSSPRTDGRNHAAAAGDSDVLSIAPLQMRQPQAQRVAAADTEETSVEKAGKNRLEDTVRHTVMLSLVWTKVWGARGRQELRRGVLFVIEQLRSLLRWLRRPLVPRERVTAQRRARAEGGDASRGQMPRSPWMVKDAERWAKWRASFVAIAVQTKSHPKVAVVLRWLLEPLDARGRRKAGARYPRPGQSYRRL